MAYSLIITENASSYNIRTRKTGIIECIQIVTTLTLNADWVIFTLGTGWNSMIAGSANVIGPTTDEIIAWLTLNAVTTWIAEDTTIQYWA